MTNRDELNLANYNALLKACDEYKSCFELKDVIYMDDNTIRYKCEFLREQGLMKRKKKVAGRHKQVKNFYLALASEYKLEDYEKILALRLKNKSKAGLAAKAVRDAPIIPKDYTEPSLAQPVYRHNPDQHRDKYKAQAKHMHEDHKSPRVYAGIAGYGI